MVQKQPSPRFTHILLQLQQERQKNEVTIDEYQSQLTSIIEEETHSGEKTNQDERRAYLWTQAEDVWKKLEDQREKDKQEKDRLSTMQLSQAEAAKLRPFTEYIQKILNEDLPEMRANSRRARGWYNFLQGVVILGSAIATAIVNISELPRWETSIVTVIVAATSGILVAYKFKDRSTTLQQTGDLIEAEHESFRLQLDEYDTPDIEARYKLLTRRLKRLKEEQRSRELLLEQSPETKQAQPAQA